MWRKSVFRGFYKNGTGGYNGFVLSLKDLRSWKEILIIILKCYKIIVININ